MTTALHKDLTPTDIHGIISYDYANEAARLAATGFVSNDVGKVARQNDTTPPTFWLLTKTDPIWRRLETDPVTWGSVATALGGQAGANAGWIFKSDGAGSGTMGKNRQNIANRLTVGTTGDVDHTSISAAVTAALTAGASNFNPFFIEVYPGFYVESPFTLPPGVIISTTNGERHGLAYIIAASPTSDLITGTGGTIVGFGLQGVTDNAKALIRCSTPGQPTSVRACSIGTCSNGIMASGGAVALVDDIAATVFAPASAIGTVITADTGATILVKNGVMSVPTAILGPYTGSNPIETCVKATNGAQVLISGVDIIVAGNTNTQVGVFVDSSSNVGMSATSLSLIYTALKVGPNGNSIVTLQSTSFATNTVNIQSLSATAVIYASISVDVTGFDLVTGTTFAGLVQNQSTASMSVYRLHGVYPSGADLDVLEKLFHNGSTAILAGGELTDGGGLDVDYAAGIGVIRRTSDSDIYDVSWTSGTLTLPANSNRYVSYQETTDTVVLSSSEPGDSDILLGQVITGASAIRYIHKTGWNTNRAAGVLRDYLYDTRRVILKSGLAAQAGSTATKITTNSGSYYLALSIISYTGVTDATFSAFYGTDGATEVTAQTNVNTTQYDVTGTLTSMTASYYRSDTLYLTSGGQLALIFGTAEYSTQLAAESASAKSPMSFIEPSAIAIASVIVQQGVGIVSFVDRRPTGASSGGGGGGGATSHGGLSGLTNDDHTQYLLASGARAMSGNLNMGSNNITSAGTINSVNIAAHASRHNPGGADALATALPQALTVGGSNALGSDASFANSGHIHAIARGTPVAVGTANAAGSASTFAGSDHVHAHGNQAGGALHADVIAAGASGFMTGADKTKLDGIATGATVSALRQTEYANLSAAATTTSATYVTLLSATITLSAGGILMVWAMFSASVSNANRSIDFELTVNGTSVNSASTRTSAADLAQGGGLLARLVAGAGVAVVGSNTVLLRWRVSSNTARCDPTLTGNGTQEHASIMLQETSA